MRTSSCLNRLLHNKNHPLNYFYFGIIFPSFQSSFTEKPEQIIISSGYLALLYNYYDQQKTPEFIKWQGNVFVLQILASLALLGPSPLRFGPRCTEGVPCGNGHPPDVQRPQSPLNITVGDGLRILSECFMTYEQKNPVQYCNSSCIAAQGFLCLFIFFNFNFGKALRLFQT